MTLYPGFARGGSRPPADRGRRRCASARREIAEGPLEALGAVPGRAAVGHRARGLLARRRRVGLLPARSRAQPRLPLGRGRPRSASATITSCLCFALALWNGAGPDPEGAPVRADRARGQSRRGRQGVLLLPRRDADPLLHAGALQVPAARVPVRATRRGESRGAAATSPSSSSLDTGVLRRRPLLRRVRRVREGDPGRHPDPHHRRRTADPTPATLHLLPHALVPQHLVWGRDARRRAAAPSSSRAPAAHGRVRADASGARPVLRSHVRGRAASCSSPTTRPTSGACSARRHRRRYVKDALPRPRRPRASGRGQPGGDAARRRPRATRSTIAAGRDRRRSGCGSSTRRADASAVRRRSSTRVFAARRREADEFYATRHPARARPTDARDVAAPGARGPAVVQAVLPLRRRRTGSTATPASRRRRPSARHGPQPRLDAPLQRRRHLDAGQVGVSVVRRVGPRVPRDPDGAGRSGVRQGAARCSCCASGTCTRTGRLPAYEWDVRRRQPAGARLGGLARLPDRRRAAATRDREFLERVFHKLLLNFTWWVNRKDRDGNNVFEGGFLGLDNIGVVRSLASRCPPAARLEQADGTALDGLLLPRPCSRSRSSCRATTRPTRTSRPSSSSTSSPSWTR